MELHRCKRSRYSINENEALTNKTDFPLLELPYDILCNIFARLPLKNIIQCRCICNTLLELIKDPYFSKIHLSISHTLTTNLTTSLVMKEERVSDFSLCFFTSIGGKISLSSSTSTICDQRGDCFSFRPGRLLNSNTSDCSFSTGRFNLLNSCNGLICVCFNRRYGVWNPLLHELVYIPFLTACSHDRFGYCQRTGEYKIISYDYKPWNKTVAFVHTLGSDSWRKVEEYAPTPIRHSFDPLLNGALHWITSSYCISSFELESEKFKIIPSPPHFTTQYLRKVSEYNIGVLRDCLCMCYNYDESEFEVWVMREYGVQESWYREFSFEIKLYPKLQVEYLKRPIRFLRNGDLCFTLSWGTIVTYSPKKRTFTQVTATSSRAAYHRVGKGRAMWERGNVKIALYDLSFISLMDVMGTKRTQVLKLDRG